MYYPFHVPDVRSPKITKMKSCIVYNADSTDELRPLLDYCAQHSGCELRPSSKPGGIQLLVRAAMDDAFERIVVAGGDGTLSEVVNGIAPDFGRVEVALLPFGTGNDFARSLGIPLDEAGIRNYLAFDQTPVQVDLVAINDGAACFANAANGGLGGSVAKVIESESKERWGPVAYWMSALSTAMDSQTYHARIDLDGELIEQEIVAIAVANGRYVGGGFPVAPDAFINDGMLDITIVPPLPIVELATSGLNFALSRTEMATNVRRYRAKRVRIHAEPQLPFSIDGETASTFDASFQVLPKVLRILPGPLESALVPAS